MPQILAHWSFRDQPENIDIARIFREAPAEARVLSIMINGFRILAMRAELFDQAMQTKVHRPQLLASFAAGVPRDWTPAWSGSDARYNVATERGAGLTPVIVTVPAACRCGWVHSFGVACVPSIRVFDLLDWLNRADAYYDSLVETKVRRTDMKVCIVLSDPWLQYKNGAVCNDPWRGSWFVFGRNYEQYKSCFATTGSHYKGVWAQRPCEQRALRFLGRCEGGGVLT